MGLTDSVFGISPQVMALRARRLELLSANLANVDTPGFKARDIDFRAALETARGDGVALSRTDRRHLGGAGELSRAPALYRVPAQASADGNTVETQREHAVFMDNAIRYQASVNFLDSRIKSTLRSIRGE